MSQAHASVFPSAVSFHSEPASCVRLSLVPQAPVRATLPPAVRAARMMGTVRLVASRMARRLPRHVEIDDLVGAGALGLADAFSRRNGMPGDEFEAFASYRVRGAMLDELRRLDAMPRRSRDKAKKVAQATRRLEQKGAAASEEEIAAELGIEVSALQGLRTELDAHRAPLPLNAPTGEDDDSSQEIADAKAEAPDAILARQQMGELIVEGIHTLPERMRAVLVGLYVESQTLKEIGKALGVSESRVCQIHSEAIAILRSRFEEESAPPQSGIHARNVTALRPRQERAASSTSNTRIRRQA